MREIQYSFGEQCTRSLFRIPSKLKVHFYPGCDDTAIAERLLDWDTSIDWEPLPVPQIDHALVEAVLRGDIDVYHRILSHTKDKYEFAYAAYCGYTAVHQGDRERSTESWLNAEIWDDLVFLSFCAICCGKPASGSRYLPFCVAGLLQRFLVHADRLSYINELLETARLRAVVSPAPECLDAWAMKLCIDECRGIDTDIPQLVKSWAEIHEPNSFPYPFTVNHLAMWLGWYRDPEKAWEDCPEIPSVLGPRREHARLGIVAILEGLCRIFDLKEDE